jgi:hypothetical protein
MKLKRTKEQAEDEGRSLREVGIEKYGVKLTNFVIHCSALITIVILVCRKVRRSFA